VVQAGERTRLVLNLRNMVPYESKIDGSSFLITLAATGGAQQAATGAARFAEGRLDLQHTLKDVNFRRGRGGEGRIVVELSDTSFVREVRPIQYDPNRLVQGTRSGYSGEKLSLNFQNVEVRSVLNVIADFTDLNIITSDTVGGNLTLRLKDVPWDQALDIILQ